jgi:hypothetical protein
MINDSLKDIAYLKSKIPPKSLEERTSEQYYS